MMIKAAVIGLGSWGKTAIIAPVLSFDPKDEARAAAATLGIETI